MLALALVLEGATRTEAARAAGMDRQTLRDWVHRYNAEGVAGLASRVGPGPARRLNDEQTPCVRKVVRRREMISHFQKGGTEGRIGLLDGAPCGGSETAGAVQRGTRDLRRAIHRRVSMP
jgi:transposase